MSSSVEPTGTFTGGQKALLRGWWKKVTGMHTKAENFKDMEVPNTEKGVFGVPLSQSLDYAHSGITYIDDRTGSQCYGIVPTIVAKCGSYLKEQGLMSEGIFRLPGSARRLRMLQSLFDTPDTYGSKLDWHGYTVHDAASILRRFINHLPEPVITLAYYRPFKATMDQSFSSVTEKVAAFQVLIEQLPLTHQYLLLYLLDMLSIFATTSRFTKMNIDCLAAVFAPGILAHPDDTLDPASYKHSQKVLRFLIDNQEMFIMPHSEAGLGMYASTTPTKSLRLFSQPFTTDHQTASLKYHHLSYKNDDHLMPAICSLVPGNDLNSKDDNRPARMTINQRVGRSRTLPVKRTVYDVSDSPQVVHVNRNTSQKRKMGHQG